MRLFVESLIVSVPPKNAGALPSFPSSHDTLHQAIAHHQAGRLTDAEHLYRAILERNPQNPDAQHNLGLLFAQQGHYSEALPLLKMALLATPAAGQFWLSYGEVLLVSGRIYEAYLVMAEGRKVGLAGGAADKLESLIQEAWEKAADITDLKALMQSGQLAEVEHRVNERISRCGDIPVLVHLLGEVLLRQERAQESLLWLEKACALLPETINAWNQRALALSQLKRYDEAHDIYLKAFSLAPDAIEIRINIGANLNKAARHEEAVTWLQPALESNPESVGIRANLAIALVGLGQESEARPWLEAIIDEGHQSAEVLNAYGALLTHLGESKNALDFLRKAIELKPNLAEAHYSLGAAFLDLGRLNESEASMRRALAINPNFAEPHCGLGSALAAQTRLEEAEIYMRRALELKPNYEKGLSSLLFNLNYTDKSDQDRRLNEAKRYGLMVQRNVAEPLSNGDRLVTPNRLRIGMVSGDFCSHPIGYFLEGLLKCYSTKRLELIAYPTQSKVDEVTQRLQQYFSAWSPLYGLTDSAAARRIHDDGIHVLIDLSGHTNHHRLPVFAFKPAPIQASWLGYFATTGVIEMDYLIGDPFVTPSCEEGHFTEEVWRLPETYLCFTPPDFNLPVNPLPASVNDCITFGCFNNISKINDEVVMLWAQILKRLPESRLLLKAKQLADTLLAQSIRERFASHGISSERLLLEGPSTRAELLATYNRVDIALDPFPYPGGTTSVEGLWMGVPVLTKRGNRFLSHVGESIANNAGLSDWVAANNDEYVTKAIAFASDTKRLAQLREGLRQQVLASPIFDAARFARHFEDAMWGMWNRRQEQQGEE